MHVKHLRSARSVGFTQRTLSQRVERPVTQRYLRHKSSFLIAAFALTAFVSGNMMGTHGWQVFWKSVFGEFDDSLIAYTGTVTPVAKVADLRCWAEYGGNTNDHTWRQVPEKCQVALPRYAVDNDGHPTHPVYSVGYMGSYDGREGKGSHPGIDIRLPSGTPVRVIANGIVTEVGDNSGGFGKFIVVRHPNVPDPDNPKKVTTIFSAYAHLSAQFVIVGQVVNIGEDIGLSGQSGNASGPHLHFQIDRDETVGGDTVPWYPFWPFSGTDMRLAGLGFSQAVSSGLHQEVGYQYTVHPMQYVQANYTPIVLAKATTGRTRIVAMADTSDKPAKRATRTTQLKSRATIAKERRLQQRATAERTTPPAAPAMHTAAPAPVTSAKPVAGVEIRHDGSFEGREWQTVRITLLDDTGQPTTDAGFSGKLYLRTAFGHAEFDPPALTPTHFANGEATVRMLPQGTQTVIIDVKPFGNLSSPIKYAGR